MIFYNEKFPNMSFTSGNIVAKFTNGEFRTDDPKVIEKLKTKGFFCIQDTPIVPIDDAPVVVEPLVKKRVSKKE